MFGLFKKKTTKDTLTPQQEKELNNQLQELKQLLHHWTQQRSLFMIRKTQKQIKKVLVELSHN